MSAQVSAHASTRKPRRRHENIDYTDSPPGLISIV
jgi:hypothetical protein